jgi:hypothetical protein
MIMREGDGADIASSSLTACLALWSDCFELS